MILKKVKLIDFYELVTITLLFTLFLNFLDVYENKVLYINIFLSSILWFHLIKDYKFTKKEFLLVVIICMYTLFFSIIGKGSYQLIVIELPIALYLLKKKNLNETIWTILPIIIMYIVLMNWKISINRYSLFRNTSRNYISVFGLYSIAIYNIMKEKNSKPCSLLVIIIYFFICINAVGRGGIITSGLILILFIYKRIFGNIKRNLKSYIKIFIFFIITFIMVLFISNNISYVKINYFGRFFGSESSAEVSTKHRITMVREYLNECTNNIKSFFIGADAKKVTKITGNLHNSYLQLHSSYGIIALIFFMYASIKSCIYMKRNFLFDSLYIFIGILVRAAIDWMFPAFPIDVFIMYYILLPTFYPKGPLKDE